MANSLLTLLVAVAGFIAVFVSPASAADSSDNSSSATPGYAQIKSMVDAGDYIAALPELAALTEAEPQNADAWNLLGFTYRQLGNMDDSAGAYLTVLTINPDHLGALEYQGELFLQTGKPDLAKANLDRLKSLCGRCEEADDLEVAIMDAGV